MEADLLDWDQTRTANEPVGLDHDVGDLTGQGVEDDLRHLATGVPAELDAHPLDDGGDVGRCGNGLGGVAAAHGDTVPRVRVEAMRRG